jgi:hypothetical protein
MNELLPIVGGLVLGVLLTLVQRPRLRVALGVLGAFATGFLATVASGEYRIGWEYLLFDVPLSALSATGAYLTVRRWSGSGAAAPSRKSS